MTARKSAAKTTQGKRARPARQTLHASRHATVRRKVAAARRGRVSSATADVGEAALRTATGKGWSHWFALLDRSSAEKLDHRGIVAILGTERGISGWWRQMIAVAYERARGLRQRHENSSGFCVTGSKTVRVPLSELYGAWVNAGTQRAWLGAPAPAVRTATPMRALRLTWHDGTWVIVSFLDKGNGRSQVAVSHERLPNARTVARYKKFWKDALGRLQHALEPQMGIPE